MTNKSPYFAALMRPKNLFPLPVNRALLRTMAGPGRAFPHRGNLLHMAFSRPTAQQPGCQPRDVTMFDWAEVITFFHTDASTPLIVDPARYTGAAIPCLKLNCHGDCARYGIATTEEGITMMGTPHRKLHHWVSPYAVMLQLPWVSRWAYTNLDLVTTSADPVAAQQNDQAAFLDACAQFCPSTGVVDHIVHEPFGGTQLLFRTDGAAVHLHHLTAFNRFLASIIPAGQNRISHVVARAGDTTLAKLRSRITKTAFASFWEEYVAGLDRETDHDHVPASPYDATPGPHAQEASLFGEEDRAKIEAAWQPEQHGGGFQQLQEILQGELAEMLPGVNVLVRFHP
ncbi:hypothetical protein B0T14DRAFT_925 [Immersiella caudata]|uniref:Uncharacterized protein n=1 Tax=Immersiella caudata TaxID=314043 RepID=A0AA39XC97_9PEZI|nr:hypothetical protein B0T14DRAFT_925 [Immersiella caudata]